MPELPEVETIRRGLATVLPSRVICDVTVNYSGSIKTSDSQSFRTGLSGRMVTGTGRRGKYLFIHLDDSSTIVIHLRMTGRLVFSETTLVTDKHTHVIFHFQDGSSLYFNDVRKFGTIWWLPDHRLTEISGLATLGPEPLSADFHFPYLNREVEKKTLSIKALLLNQTFLAGLGNIYADEILHRAGILPDRQSRSLSREERLALFEAVREVLDEAIEWRGTTMNDYRDAAGLSGSFQNRLRVYQRQNETCPRCGNIICRSIVAGRGTHFCPNCQY